MLDVAGWPGHRAGQHVDVRLTAEDGYQAERSYSIASAPGEPLALTVERLDDGEVSPYLVDEVRAGDRFEVRGPIGGYFVWEPATAGAVLLVAGGSGVVPLMAMLRHRARAGATAPVRLLYSSRALRGRDLPRRARGAGGDGLEVVHTLTRERRPAGPATAAHRRELLGEVAWPAADEPRASTSAARPASSRRPRTALVALGYDPRWIRTERFGPTGLNGDRATALDGNAAGGLLRELFAVDLTVAPAPAPAAARESSWRRPDVYSHAPGVVVRCRHCDRRDDHDRPGPERTWIDLRGTRGLEL